MATEEIWDDTIANAKAQHDQRVGKTPERLIYAYEQFKQNNIEYVVKNATIGHIHCWRKSDNMLFQFWVGTGKVLGYEQRGIHFLIQELNK